MCIIEKGEEQGWRENERETIEREKTQEIGKIEKNIWKHESMEIYLKYRNGSETIPKDPILQLVFFVVIVIG